MKTIEVLDRENGRKWTIEKLNDSDYLVTYYEYFKALGWKSYKAGELCDKSYIEYTFDIDLSKPQPQTILI